MVFLLGAAAAGWLIYDMATATEAPSQTYAVMKYALLAILVIATVYSGAKWLTTAPAQKPKAPPRSKGRVHNARTR
jgi:hypothetical protein